MLTTIKLDDQASVMTNKVDDVRTNERLAPEARSTKAVRTQVIPESFFRLAH